jgi:diacylglycerol kinase
VNLPEKFTQYKPFSSFRYAIIGVWIAFQRERNLPIQIAIGLIATLSAIVTNQYVLAMANFVLMGIVLSLELLNSAIETLCDLVHPEYSLQVKHIKDISAGSVLVISLVWLVVILYQILVMFFLKTTILQVSI